MVRRLALITAALLGLTLASIAFAAELRGTSGNDTITGTSGDDSIFGLEGNDRISGGNGNDTLDGGPGTDDLSGGTGRDVVAYGQSGAGVTVTMDDDLANDGGSGERDNVQTDVEDLAGSPLNDNLSGSSGPNSIAGAGGNDTLTGGGGVDSLFGDEGADRLQSRDGVSDTVDCGPGEDVAIVDEDDIVTNCEVVDRDRADPIATGTISHFWSASASSTKVVELQVGSVSPSNAKVDVRCKGRGCPFATKSFKPRGGRVNLKPRFKKRISAGGSIEVRIVAPGRTGKVLRFAIQRGKVPTRKLMCLKSGASKPVSTGCPTF